MKRKLYMFLFTKTRKHLKMLIAGILITGIGSGIVNFSVTADAACPDSTAVCTPVTYVSYKARQTYSVPKSIDFTIDIDESGQPEVASEELGFNLEFNSGVQYASQNEMGRDELITMAQQCAAKWGLDPSVICGLIETESQWTVNIIGDDGESYGLMQIQPKWWYDYYIELGCSSWLDASDNLQIGCAIMSHLLTVNNGDYYKALQQYNTGKHDTNNGYADRVLTAAKNY